MSVDPQRAICGIATVYDQRSRNGDRAWKREHFERFLAVETAVPLRLEHGPLITHHGAIRYVGVVRQLASIAYPVAGLLILAEVDDADGFGDKLLADLASLGGHSYLPSCWHLSVAAHVGEEDGEQFAWPFEISIVHTPAIEDTKILAVGSHAIDVWRLLTTEKQSHPAVA